MRVFSSAAVDLLVDVNGYVPAGSPVTTLQPARLLDTRSGGQAIDGVAQPASRIDGGGIVEVPVAGRGGVPASATTAILNVTAVGAGAAGYATVSPCGDPPNASNLNYQPGEDVANAVVTQLSPTGSVCVFTSAAADVHVDVDGFSTGAALTSFEPRRFVDTRPGAPIAAGATGEFVIAGYSGVPVGTTTVLLNVTAVGADAAAYATVFPCGDAPNASNLNYQPGEDVANAVVARLSAAGTVCIRTSATADFLIDVTGHA